MLVIFGVYLEVFFSVDIKVYFLQDLIKFDIKFIKYGYEILEFFILNKLCYSGHN